MDSFESNVSPTNENENDEEDVSELLTNNRREVQILENDGDDINSVEDEFNELEEDEEIPDLESQYLVDSESDDDSDDDGYILSLLSPVCTGSSLYSSIPLFFYHGDKVKGFISHFHS